MLVESERSKPEDSTKRVCRGGSGSCVRLAGFMTEFCIARSSLPNVSPQSLPLMLGLVLAICSARGAAAWSEHR